MQVFVLITYKRDYLAHPEHSTLIANGAKPQAALKLVKLFLDNFFPGIENVAGGKLSGVKAAEDRNFGL